jgi:hypothetical protein
MVIGDKTYRSDVIVYPDGRVADNWRRASGHRLRMADIMDLLVVKPDVIVAGTGIYGRMQIDPDVNKRLAEQNIALVAMRTKKAAKEFNRLSGTPGRVAGCFHLTC